MRTPTAAAAAAFSTAAALPLLSSAATANVAANGAGKRLLLSGGSGDSTQDRVTVNALGLGCGERKKEAPATGAEAGGGGEEEEEGSFPPLFQRQSRHTKFDDDDDDDDDEKDGERKLQIADDEPRQQGKKKEEGEKTKKRRREDDAGDDKEAAAAAPLPSLPAAPCRVDLSLTAATIAVALRSSSYSPLKSSSSAAEEDGKKRRSSSSGATAAAAAPRGNYPRYYGYRLSLQKEGPSARLSPAHEALYGPGAADPRLRALLPYLGGLFRGRRLLDVGCNGGVLTLALAAAAGASSAVGVDLDAGLVRSARARCLRLRESAAAWERGLRAGRGALGDEIEDEEGKDPPPPRFFLPEPGGRSLAGRRAAARACIRALRATTFRHEDFVAAGGGGQKGQQPEQQQEQQQLFGAAVCLSVTKWVHLCHGDEGIERLFARLSRCLGKGAHLVLEPQPWRSYQRAVRKRGVREAAAGALPLLQLQSSTSTSSQQQQRPPPPPPRSLASLRIRPEDFVSILEAPRHGFALVRSLGAPEGAAQGFDRPLLLFRKK